MGGKGISRYGFYIERPIFKMESVVTGRAHEPGEMFTARAEFDCSYHINNFDYPKVHSHVDFWDFSIITNGVIENHVDGNVEVCGENTLFFMTTGNTHFLKKRTESIRYINITVRESYIIPILDAISKTLRTDMQTHRANIVLPKSTVLNIESLLYASSITGNDDRKTKNDLICSALMLIVQRLHEHYINTPRSSSGFLTKLSYVTARSDFVSYTVSDLCRELNYSKAQLSRLFKQHLNTTPGEYLSLCKFKYALYLLVNTELKLADIASEIGYSDPSHFSRNFKAKYGSSPVKYRKQQCNGAES